MKTFVLDIRTATPHFPGIGRYVAGLAPALAAQLTDEERLILLCNDAAQEAGFNHMLSSNSAVATCCVHASPFSFSQQWQVARSLRQVSKDQGTLIYHSPYYLMPYWLDGPTVLTVHDLIPILLPKTVSSRARLLFRLTHRLALRSADRIIAVSAATGRDLARAFDIDETKISVLPHGVEPRFHPQPQAEIERVQTAYDLPARFVLYLGINKPHKNLVGLVQAYAMLPEGMPPLVIAGAWDARYPEAKQHAARLQLAERVRFLGPVHDADLPGLYSAATVFVFPSCYEGFGFPVLEAMACGTPVACSNVSSLPEVAGEAAAYFDPSQPAAIATQLLRLLQSDSLCQMHAAKGGQRALHFTWKQTASATIALYRSVNSHFRFPDHTNKKLRAT